MLIQALTKHDGAFGMRASFAELRRRIARDCRERAAERAKAGEPDLHADVGDAAIGGSQQVHGPLDATPLQIAMGGFAEGVLERTKEVGLRHVGDAGQLGQVEHQREVAIDGVVGAEHPPVDLLDRVHHRHSQAGLAANATGACAPRRRG